MATLYERYNPTLNANGAYRLDLWACQTFTIGNTGGNERHGLYSVKLHMGRMGAPSHDFHLDVTNTSGGKPSGSALTTLTVASSEFPPSGSLLYEFVFPDNPIFEESTMYALVGHQDGGGPGEYTKIFGRLGTGAYTGGAWMESSDGGLTWSGIGTADWYFDEYGVRPSETSFPTPVIYGKSVRPQVNKLGGYYKKKVF